MWHHLDPFFQEEPFVHFIAPPPLGGTTVERSGRSDKEWIGFVKRSGRSDWDRIGRSCREWIAIVESAKHFR
jgi:hypothetical protein